MNKRGSHIDIILSFVIFISFLIFLYALMQPSIASKDGKTAFLNYMGGEIAKNLTAKNLTRISINIPVLPAESCMRLIDFGTNAGISSLKLEVRNSTGTPISISREGDDLFIDISASEESKMFYAYYSPGFNEIGETGACNQVTYSINQAEEYNSYYIWSEDIDTLIDAYDADYGSVKEHFNLPPHENFRFDFIYQDGTIAGTVNNVPSSINVYSETFPVIYISEDKIMESGNLVVMVW